MVSNEELESLAVRIEEVSLIAAHHLIDTGRMSAVDCLDVRSRALVRFLRELQKAEETPSGDS